MTAKTTWGMGEYARMAELLMPVAELVVERAEVAAGTRVLDVACGTGNVALLAAERGAAAVGVMYAVDHTRAAAELARVCRPGGRVIVTAWTPESFMPSLGAAVGPFL